MPDDVPIYSVYDVNKDEVIDFTDVVITLRAIGLTTDNTTRIATAANGDPIFALECDVDKDGKVEMTDIFNILANYGNAPVEYVDPRL